MDLLANWQLWAAMTLVGVALEFIVGGVGILVVVSSAAALTTIFILTLGAFSVVPSWKAVLFAFTAFVVVAIAAFIVYRRYRPGKAHDVDINTY